MNGGTKQRGRKRINGGGKGDKVKERMEEIRWMSGEEKRRRDEGSRVTVKEKEKVNI